LLRRAAQGGQRVVSCPFVSWAVVPEPLADRVDKETGDV